MTKIIDAILCKHLPARDIRNANIVNVWALIWVLSLAGITFLMKNDLFTSPLFIAFGFIVNTGLGIGVVLSYKKMLTELDEMERKIQLDALALSVGISIIFFGSYSVLDSVGMVEPLKAANLIMLMALTYTVGLIVGRVRYA